MPLFGIGGSSSRQSSESSSSSFDNLDQVGFNFGQSGSSSRGSSVAGSSSSVAFEDIFAKLYGGASGAAAGVDTGSLTRASNMLFGSGARFLDSLDQGGAGADYLANRVNNGDRLVDEQIGLLGDDLTRFRGEIDGRRITEGGVSAGTFGGGRTGVQRDIADRNALEAFARGSADIRLGSQAQLDQVATGLAGDETSRFLGGLSSIPGLQGIAESGSLASLAPFMALSGILGGPTVLSESSSISDQLAEAFGLDVGFDRTTGRAGSQSSSTSSGRSASFDLGFG